MRPTVVRYEAPPFGVGELWLEGNRVVWSELPRQTTSELDHVGTKGSDLLTNGRNRHVLAGRLSAFFAGSADDFGDVDLELEDGFYGDCARALRAVPRGEVVTYGELAVLAGRPGAARAAGTFCARNRLSPFVPCHRVVSADGIGSFGSLGIDYKRAMLALEGVTL